MDIPEKISPNTVSNRPLHRVQARQGSDWQEGFTAYGKTILLLG